MAITDYLQGINRATSGEKTDVKTATDQLSEYQAGAGSLPDKLKEALNTKLNNNKDIIGQQSKTMENYFNSGANARVKYKDVWDPLEKAKLVQQDRSMALRPYDTLSGVLENRMGTVADVVNAGVSGWKGLVDSSVTKLDTAKSMLSTALQSYLSASSQQQAADDMAFKIAQAEEASRQFELNYGLESTKVSNQSSQFEKELAAKLKIAGMSSGGSGSGGGSGPGGAYTAADVSGIADVVANNAIQWKDGKIVGFNAINPDDINKLANDKNANAVSVAANKRLSEIKKGWEDSQKPSTSGGYLNTNGSGFMKDLSVFDQNLIKPLVGTPGGNYFNPLIDYFINRK